MWDDVIKLVNLDGKYSLNEDNTMYPNDYQIEMGEIMEEFKEYNRYCLMQEIREERNKYKELYNAVDKMFYDICNQWEDWMDIEMAVGDLRKIMYGEIKED